MEISKINPDGTTYDLKDATARSEIEELKENQNYSTEEIDTGKKWINGKPIYRKSGFIASITGTENYAIDTTITTANVETILDLRCSAKASSGNLLFGGGYSGYTQLRMSLVLQSTGLLLAQTHDPYTGFSWTIEYVKK